MKLSNIILGVSLMIIISTGLMIFLVDAIEQYQPSNIPADYNKSFVRIQNNLNSLSAISNSTSDSVSDLNGNQNIVQDFLGFFFGKGYKAATTLVEGVKLNAVILNEGIDNTLGATPIGSTIKNVGLLLIGAFILLMLLAFIIKSDWI
jgi:hypothetical protein